MVKGKFVRIVVLFITVYVAWVGTSAYLAHATNFAWATRDQKISRIQEIEEIAGLIVGGSNAVYSLSAERMSTLTSEPWFNASIINEGFTFENNLLFLDDIVNSIDATKVKTVILSSIRLVKSKKAVGMISRRGYGFDGGKLPPVWLPYDSIFGFINSEHNRIFPSFISRNGDLLHDEAEVCTTAGRPGNLQWATNDQIVSFIDSWLPAIHSRFPNAEVVITIPSRYLSNEPDPLKEEAYVNRLETHITTWIANHKEAANLSVSVTPEPNYFVDSILCNNSNHFNAFGRQLRTNALYAAMVNK
ncbi:unannotated protein [freshwater metagenome]|uniref:Unannotated protein n=1 Tax=freshwater metagenome TaxID=449393 RepID=A0A6J6AY18_9ZZZZ|nr:hypothetical protein [Actinomycetota bacterium]